MPAQFEKYLTLIAQRLDKIPNQEALTKVLAITAQQLIWGYSFRRKLRTTINALNRLRSGEPMTAKEIAALAHTLQWGTYFITTSQYVAEQKMDELFGAINKLKAKSSGPKLSAMDVDTLLRQMFKTPDPKPRPGSPTDPAPTA